MDAMKTVQMQTTNLNKLVENQEVPEQKKLKKGTDSEFEVEMGQLGALLQPVVAQPLVTGKQLRMVNGQPQENGDLAKTQMIVEGQSQIQTQVKSVAGQNTAAARTGLKPEETLLKPTVALAGSTAKDQIERKPIAQTQMTQEGIPSTDADETPVGIELLDPVKEKPLTEKPTQQAGQLFPLTHPKVESLEELVRGHVALGEEIKHSIYPSQTDLNRVEAEIHKNSQSVPLAKHNHLSGGEFLKTLSVVQEGGDQRTKTVPNPVSGIGPKAEGLKVNGLVLTESFPKGLKSTQEATPLLVASVPTRPAMDTLGSVQDREFDLKPKEKTKFSEKQEDGQTKSSSDWSPTLVPQLSTGIDSSFRLGSKIEVTAQVIPDPAKQGRMTLDSLTGISNGIRYFTTQGGGEFQVRLRPDHLGELSVRVIMDGNRVGLKIQASDDRAKKILEDNIGHLQESLSAQNLSLIQVEMTVSNQDTGSERQNFQTQAGLHDGAWQDMNQSQNRNQNQNQRDSQQWSHSERFLKERVFQGKSEPKVPISSIHSMMAQSKNYQANSRLDVRG